MNNNFIDLGISPPILKALEEMGFEKPTEVQSKAIPHILNKEDLIVKSKTGSGKTAVFGVSILQMSDPSALGPQGLILAPTRELAVQVDNDLKRMAKHLKHKTLAVFGQHSMNIEIQALNKGATIVTGTPGRVFDHIEHGVLNTRNIRFLVLDEADRMLDMGFIDQVMRIIRTLPKDRITLLFSATIPPEIRRICENYMKEPVTIEIESQTKTVDTTQQLYYRVNHNEKNTQLSRLLLIEQPESCMIFCNTRIGVDRVYSYLSRKGYAVHSLHGDIPQSKRLKTIQQFKQGEFHMLVATDVAARGLHIDSLSLVINYDIPVERDSYIHRIGRTGRAGNVGRAISLVTSDDIMSLYEIEEHIGVMIAEEELPSDEVFNERKASADSWIQANTQKAPQPESEHGTRGSQNRQGQKRPQQSNDRYGGRKQKYNENNRQTSKDQCARRDNASTQTGGDANYRAKGHAVQSQGYNPSRQPRGYTPGRTTSKPPYSNTTRPAAPQTGRNARLEPANADIPKKSLFKRIIQRIFGKKDT